MKNIFFLATFIVALFTSCSESEYEFHQTYFNPQLPEGKVLYADQTNDSTRVISYDPWTALCTFNDGSDAWFSISPTECKFIAGEQFASTRVDITASPNTTGKVRYGYISVSSFDVIRMPVKQTSWLNITYPFGEIKKIDEEGNSIPEEDRLVTFSGKVPASNQFNVEFTVYSNDATLTSDAEWLKPSTTTFSAGYHDVAIVAEANPNKVERTANLLLTSNGVTTPITITQAKANDK